MQEKGGRKRKGDGGGEMRESEREREEGDQTEGGRGKRRMLVYNPDFHFFPNS